jgi:oligopeptide/dipeptide ABC transporter ATP-binding protein
MNQPLIEIKNVSKHFGTLRAVQDVSLNIFAGETLGLAGESGCGKSTIGKLLVRLLEPTAGSIYFDGCEIGTLKGRALLEWRRHVQMVFQNPTGALNPCFTIEEILREPLEIHGRDTHITHTVLHMLEQVGLQPSHLRRLPHELSGGQKQRVSIARALMLQPEVLICDEPLSALDVSVQAQIINLFKDLQKAHRLTSLFISHDLAVLRYLTDRMAIMYLGQLVELAPSAALYENPLHPYTQALLSAIPLPDPQAERKRQPIVLKGELPSPLNPPTGCPFHTRCPHALPICQVVKPQLQEKNLGHYVACHLA